MAPSIVSENAASASPGMKKTGLSIQDSTAKAAIAKQASVTSCARKRPRALSSVSANALAMVPKKSGVTASACPLRLPIAIRLPSVSNTRSGWAFPASWRRRSRKASRESENMAVFVHDACQRAPCPGARRRCSA
ncbi:hypothetical protein GmRootV213_57370 (plasmid) [Variovorax sp. V213]